MSGIVLAENGWAPDFIVRRGIRKLLDTRLESEARRYQSGREPVIREYIEELRSSPIAVETEAANEQHYEAPTAFFQTILGPRLKYSSCYWTDGVTTLAEAEDTMLRMTADRAGIVDGQSILDLGCGWGSFSLWAAEQFPHSSILGVSNSCTQREFIVSEAGRRGLSNIEIVTADMNEFDPGRRFDRIVSIEMFEHLRNYGEIFRRIQGWLRPEGRLFVHIFCHREFAYLFETEGDDNWMGKYFFTGGQMPSQDLLPRFGEHLSLVDQWSVNGVHYARTLRAWLNRLDAARDRIIPMFAPVYGEEETDIWINRWRIFLMACEELFAFRGGEEWFVGHYLFEPNPS